MAFGYTGEKPAPGVHFPLSWGKSPTRASIPRTAASGLRYTFNIKRGAETYEVGIDARTGVVLENTVERQGPH